MVRFPSCYISNVVVHRDRHSELHNSASSIAAYFETMPNKANSKTTQASKGTVGGSATGATGPTIVATSQTSRFHADTLTTLSKELDLKQVNIAIGNHDILVDADLRLKANTSYGLVGHNGEGKSTILKAIAEKLIPGISENLRVLLVGQIEDSSEISIAESLGQVSLDDTADSQPITPTAPTVVEMVLHSDIRRNTAVWEHSLLSSALEAGTPWDLDDALTTLNLSRAKERLKLAQKLAAKRSGTRGSEARKELIVAEAVFKAAQEKADSVDIPEFDADVIAKMTSEVQQSLEEIQEILDSLEADVAEANARRILLGLGFSIEQLDAKFDTLSGGWRSRCVLSSALLQRPNLLLLDEPTNYLDIPSIIWLQEYLKELDKTTILVVAHDRDFLDAATTETIILKNRKLVYHDGAITACERAILKRRKGLIRKRDALEKKRTTIEKQIAEGAKAAKKSGDDNKARMVKSRQKKLDERFGADFNEKGQRFKLNRDMAGYFLSNRQGIEVEDLDPPVNLPFPDPEPMRFPGALCSATGVSFAYTRNGPNTLEDVTLIVHPRGRLGLIGKNGEGKSTLMKLLIGQLKPTKGKVERHPRLRFGYYSQHSVEELSSVEVSKMSSIEYFMTKLEALHDIKVDEATAFSFLGTFGLHGRTAACPIGILSGGQKVRLALSIITYPSPDLLVLDEVSTHLDMDTVTGLIRALRGFSGGIVLVSHDRHLVRCVIEGAPLLPPSELAEDDDTSDTDEVEEENTRTGQVFMVGPKGKVKLLPGGVDDYVAIVEKKLEKLNRQ